MREDVGKQYAHWPHATRSGVEARLSFRELPRGRYPLTVTFRDGAGDYLTIAGPPVHNDLPIGRILESRWRMVDPGPLDFSAWVADEDGIASVTLDRRPVGNSRRLRPGGGRSPSNPCWTRRSASSADPSRPLPWAGFTVRASTRTACRRDFTAWASGRRTTAAVARCCQGRWCSGDPRRSKHGLPVPASLSGCSFPEIRKRSGKASWRCRSCASWQPAPCRHRDARKSGVSGPTCASSRTIVSTPTFPTNCD